jgi:GTPase SAR1 family protein
MKITKLHIDQFKHLENLTFDFTYQSGERKGQPLDKICFIGQSATGKTSLLELIYEYISNAFKIQLVDDKSISEFPFPLKKLDVEIEFLINDTIFNQKKNQILFNDKIYLFKNLGGEITSLIPYNYKSRTFYFKANLISELSVQLLSTNPIELIEKYNNDFKNIVDFRYNTDNWEIIFDENIQTQILLFLLKDILVYRKNFTKKMSELIHKGLLANQKKLHSEFEKWQIDNPNSLVDFANIFNPILEKLHLEVDTVETEYSIPIKNKKNEEIIPFADTSTGTKQLLLTSLPLHSLDTKDSIILFDEPERSLYPDLQMELMDYYKMLAPDAQMIVATHSPFIAASFEPDERFILSFDEKGKVVVNRGVSPIGDDPNDMLHNDFGINYINKAGQKIHKEYVDLKQKMFFEKDEKLKKEYAKKVEEMGDAYNF